MNAEFRSVSARALQCRGSSSEAFPGGDTEQPSSAHSLLPSFTERTSEEKNHQKTLGFCSYSWILLYCYTCGILDTHKLLKSVLLHIENISKAYFNRNNLEMNPSRCSKRQQLPSRRGFFFHRPC